MRVLHRGAFLAAFLAASSASVIRAQETPSPTPTPTPGAPSKEDFDKLRKQLDDLNAKFDESKKKDAEKKAEDAEKMGEIEKKANSAFDLADALRWGTTRFLIAGTAHVDFSYNDPARNTKARSSSVFSAGLELDTLWKVNDFIFFEGGADFELNTQNGTDVSLSLCDVSFMVNDYMLIRGGLMPTAFSRYKETLDPAWINKLPDQPLLVALVPDTTVGVEVRGALPIGPMKLLYAVYTMNDPILNTSDPAANGTLNFSNYSGFDDVPGFGGKLGFLVLPELEFGGAALWSKVGARGTDYKQTDVFQFDVYARFNKKTPIGTIDVQVEWVFQHIRKATYAGAPDANGVPAFGPLRFKNESQSGYAQIGYRLTAADNEYLKNLEFVLRSDWLALPRYAAPGSNTDTNRVAAGVCYWFTPSIVLKAAYEYTSVWGHTTLETGIKTKDTESHGFVAQVAMGF